MTSPIHGATLPEGADLRCPDKLFEDVFTVYDPEDRFHACRCYGEAEAKEIISQFDKSVRLRVERNTIGELCRDVTADFFPEEDAPEELEFTPARRTALMARSGAFGR